MSPWWLLRNVFPGPLVRAVYRPMVDGLDHIPTGGAILVSNHLSRADPGFLQLVVNRPLTFAVNVRFYRRRGLSGWLLRRFLQSCSAVPVEPASAASGAALVGAAAAAVRAGRLFCMYPEGGIARDGRLHRGRTGIGRVVAVTGAPVVPVAMLNTDLLLPAVRRVPQLARVRLRIGPALEFAGWASGPDDRAGVRAITDRIMQELQALSNRSYVDEYVHR